MAGYTLHFISTTAAIGDLGHLIGRGAVLSVLLVLTLMPAFLVLFDDILMDNEFDRLRRLLRRRKGREAETEESGQEKKCRKQRRRHFSDEK
ncbi:MAG: MMPL family transporter [Enterocloster sp.]